MYDSIVFYIVGFVITTLLLSLYVGVVNVVIAGITPMKKYQTTSTNDPAVSTWVGTLFVLVMTSVVISLQTMTNARIPYKKWVIVGLVVAIFVTIGGISGAARRNIHPDDPERKLGGGTTVVNTIAGLIPIIVAVLASGGVASVLGVPGTVITAMLLFFILAIPSATGAALVMLFARSASNPFYVYGTISVVGCTLLLGTMMYI